MGGRTMRNLDVPERALPGAHAVEEVSEDIAMTFVIGDVDIRRSLAPFTRFAACGNFASGAAEREQSPPTAAVINADAVREFVSQLGMLLAVGGMMRTGPV